MSEVELSTEEVELRKKIVAQTREICRLKGGIQAQVLHAPQDVPTGLCGMVNMLRKETADLGAEVQRLTK